MTGAEVVPRVVTLLEEVKESIEAPRRKDLDLMRLHAKVTEAQSLLMGEAPVRPDEN